MRAASEIQKVCERTANVETFREVRRSWPCYPDELARHSINYIQGIRGFRRRRAVRVRQALLKTLKRTFVKGRFDGDDLSRACRFEPSARGNNLRDILLRELRKSGRLKFDLEVYDHKEGSEQHTYEYLLKCVKELRTSEKTRRNGTAITKAHGARYGTPAPSTDTTGTPRTPRGREQKNRDVHFSVVNARKDDDDDVIQRWLMRFLQFYGLKSANCQKPVVLLSVGILLPS